MRDLLLVHVMVLISLPLIVNTPSVHSNHPAEVPVKDIMPTAEICTWKDDKKAALTMTFDDGLNSHVVNASPLMDIYDIDGTFFITTNNVNIPYGATWSEWQDVLDEGHEIGSHSISHSDLTACSSEQLWEEVVLSKSILEDNLTGLDCITFSYPMGLYNTTVRNLVRENYIGARTDLHNITGHPGPEPPSPIDHYAVLPVDFGGSASLDELDSYVMDALDSRGWLVEIIHGVGESGYDPVPLKYFSNHLELLSLKRSHLWIDTFANVMKYIKLRDDSILEIDTNGSDSIDLSLVSQLLFDAPLSINISIPTEWTDVRLIKNGSSHIPSLNRSGGESFIIIEMSPGESVSLERYDLHPQIGPIVIENGTNVYYYPDNGTSNDEFLFYINYSSRANRPPAGHPRILMDIYGDGSEIWSRNMSMKEQDDNYVDGCTFSWIGRFPPGTRIHYRFEVKDTEGLEAPSPWIYTEWMQGPFLNDPPVMTGTPVYMGREGPYPVFNWTEGSDPDGDDITYRLDLMLEPHVVWFTENTSLMLDVGLDLDKVYHIRLRCFDPKGGYSTSRNASFELTNEPPSGIDEMKINLNGWGNVDILFDEASDPDGDNVRYQVRCWKVNRSSFQDLIGEIIVHENHYLNLTIEKESDYLFSVTPLDIWDSFGPATIRSLLLDLPPSPIKGLIAEDLEKNENALTLEWSPSMAIDLDHYTVLKWLGNIDDPDIWRADSFNITRNTTSFVDWNVTDGEVYTYAVIASDKHQMDLVNFSIVKGIPVDDVAPSGIEGLNVSMIENGKGPGWGVRLRWEPSFDERLEEYRIYRSLEIMDDINGIRPYSIIKVGANNTEFIDLDVRSNLTYHYTVTAVDSWGNQMKTGNQWKEATIPSEDIEDGPEIGGDDNLGPFWIFFIFFLVIFISALFYQLYSKEAKIPAEE